MMEEQEARRRGRLRGLGRKILSVEEMNEEHRYRLHLVKKAS